MLNRDVFYVCRLIIVNVCSSPERHERSCVVFLSVRIVPFSITSSKSHLANRIAVTSIEVLAVSITAGQRLSNFKR